MSILGASAQFILTYVLGVIGAILALVIPLVLAKVVGVFMPRNVLGPERIPPNQPAFGLIVAMILGFSAYFFVALSYGLWKGGTAAARTHAPGSPTIADLAFLSTLPALAGFIALVCGDFALGGVDLLKRLGLDLRRLRTGVAQGLLAGIIIIPPTYVVSILAETVYQRVGFKHESEHELLKAMGQTQHHPLLRLALILGAVAVAPLAEEFLFRGHLQTLIRRAFNVLPSMLSGKPQWMHQRFQPGFPVGGFAPLPMETIPIEPVTLPPNPSRIWQCWAAVAVTSCIFALVHPMWMWPPLLLLAMGLGYCYERTGNLWVNLTVHCLFNGTSTFFFLLARP